MTLELIVILPLGGVNLIAFEIAIIRLTPTSYLGLVNADGGSLRPIEEKGALLSIETDHLEEWWDELKDVEGLNIVHGIEVGGQGLIQEFRMLDPGGYVIEFFRWLPEHDPKLK